MAPPGMGIGAGQKSLATGLPARGGADFSEAQRRKNWGDRVFLRRTDSHGTLGPSEQTHPTRFWASLDGLRATSAVCWTHSVWGRSCHCQSRFRQVRPHLQNESARLDRFKKCVGRADFPQRDSAHDSRIIPTDPLQRVDPSRNMARYYCLSVEPTLFGWGSVVRAWGRIGASGWTKVELFETMADSQTAVGRIERVKRRRGYVEPR
jgi:predicted DNA-binding WGR domain protein